MFLSGRCEFLATQALERSGPGHRLIEHYPERGLVLERRLEDAVILEVGGDRQGELGADIRQLQFTGDEAQVLDGTDATGGPVAHEAGRLVVPLAVDEVERV